MLMKTHARGYRAWKCDHSACSVRYVMSIWQVS